MPRFVELNHPVADGMDAFPGLPKARIHEHMTHAESRSRYDGRSEFSVAMIEMVGNIGTYLDSPNHRFTDGTDVAGIALDRVAGLDAVVLQGEPGPDRRLRLSYDAADLRGKAVLIATGWDRHWDTSGYWSLCPFVADADAAAFVDAGVALVGVDCWNVDDTTDPARPTHTRLLGAGILIVENLCNLGELPERGFRFSAVPLRLVGCSSLPVRAFAELGA